MNLEGLNENILSLPFQKAVIEAAHFYADPSYSLLKSKDHTFAQLGAGLAVKLRGMLPIPTSLWWFVDELHVSDEFSLNGRTNGSLKHPAPEDELHTVGFTPDTIVMESEEELQKEALSLIERIDPELIYTLRTRISLIREGEPVYRLCSRTKKKERYDPTCSLLDAALYIRKWEATNREGMCITILPDVYKRQQDTTKLILNNAGLDIPIMNVYFNEGEDVILEKNFEAYRIPLEISLLKTEFAFDFY